MNENNENEMGNWTPPLPAPTGSANLPTLQERYAETYAWVKAQPCVSYDFVQVPIESLAELLHLPNKQAEPQPGE